MTKHKKYAIIYTERKKRGKQKMRHSLETMYVFENKIYTIDALSKLLGTDLTKIKYSKKREMGCKKFFHIADYKSKSKASFIYYSIDGEKIAWQFGEKTYFDTETERDEARENHKKEQETSKYRTKLLKKIAELDTATLEQIVNNL